MVIARLRTSLAQGLVAITASGMASGLTAALAQDPLPSFVEVTGSSGISSTYLPGNFTNSQYCGGGAVGDFDGDGLQDVFLFSGFASGVPDKLYVNDGSGAFTDQAAQWGLTLVHNGKGAAVGDYDGDGDLDLYVTSAGGANPQPGQHQLYRNNGNQSFTNVAAAAGVAFSAPNFQDGFGAAFGDYDLDGDLDLFVAGTVSGNQGTKIFRNKGDGTFSDVTGASGFFSQTPMSLHAFAPRFADMDGDRYPELLLSADFGTSRYFRNNADGTFSDVTAASSTGQDENGMGGTVGDWNGDGLLDWYVTSILSETFPSWTGNKLYQNLGSHLYSEVSQPTGTFDGGYGWGAVSIDANNDGLLDIAETNGDDNFGQWINEPSYLWMQVPGQVAFEEMGVASGFNHKDFGRGLINFDMDNDGDQDLLVLAWQAPARLYRNEIAGSVPNASWLRLFFDTSNNSTLAPDGYGTRVNLTLGTQTQMRYLAGGDNFLSQSELSIHFGLGAATVVDELEIEWSNGLVTTLTDVQINQTLVIGSPPETGSYCTAGSSASGCSALISASGTPSATATSGFTLSAGSVEGNKDGLFFFGTAGQQANTWGNGTSYQCVVPPVARAGLLSGTGTSGLCDGQFSQDLNARWCPTCPKPAQNPGAGATVQAQLWYRDPFNTSNQTTSLSDAIEFVLGP